MRNSWQPRRKKRLSRGRPACRQRRRDPCADRREAEQARSTWRGWLRNTDYHAAAARCDRLAARGGISSSSPRHPGRRRGGGEADLGHRHWCTEHPRQPMGKGPPHGRRQGPPRPGVPPGAQPRPRYSNASRLNCPGASTGPNRKGRPRGRYTARRGITTTQEAVDTLPNVRR